MVTTFRYVIETLEAKAFRLKHYGDEIDDPLEFISDLIADIKVIEEEAAEYTSYDEEQNAETILS